MDRYRQRRRRSTRVVRRDLTVLTNDLYTSAYNSATGAYAGGTGSVDLDDQGFLFNNVSLNSLGAGLNNTNTFLVSIGIKESAGTETTNAELGLSGITVVTTPEPSTVMLFLGGFGAIGLARLRRRA